MSHIYWQKYYKENMSLYSQWQEVCQVERNEIDNQQFWQDYLEQEKQNYIKVLENKDKAFDGTIAELSKEFNMTPVYFAGFIDGGNTSLKKEIDLDKLTKEYSVKLDFDFEKLYFNMLDAKAPWLYNLEQWSDVLSADKIKSITREWRLSQQAVSTKIPRNSPCPCGSGKKYKKCCGK